MAQQLYTPFMARGMASMGKAIGERRERRREDEINTAAQKAYMGDPIALQELAALDPDMAMKVEDQAGQREARAQQADLHEQAMEKNRRAFAVENREIMEELMANIGHFDDYEQAKAYAADQVGQLEAIMGEGKVPIEELTPEQFEQFRELRKIVTGDDWERSGSPQLEMGPDNKPRRVQTFVNSKTQETKVVPASLGRALTAHDPELAGQIAGAKEEAKLEVQIDLADDKAIADALGGMVAEAQADLIPARDRATKTISSVQQIRNHPGLKYATGAGWYNPGKYLPGTEAHNFMVAVEQLKGKVFAEAYETLKGGGQITEIESKKAEQALARLETSQSSAEFLAAIDEFEQATRDGYDKLVKMATTDPEKFQQMIQGELSAPLPGTDAQTAGTIANPHQPTSKATYQAIKSGEYYRDPDGKVRRKK